MKQVYFSLLMSNQGWDSVNRLPELSDFAWDWLALSQKEMPPCNVSEVPKHPTKHDLKCRLDTVCFTQSGQFWVFPSLSIVFSFLQMFPFTTGCLGCSQCWTDWMQGSVGSRGKTETVYWKSECFSSPSAMGFLLPCGKMCWHAIATMEELSREQYFVVANKTGLVISL